MNTFKSLFLSKLFLLVFVVVGSFIVIGCDGGGKDGGGTRGFVCPQCLLFYDDFCACTCTDLPDGTSESCNACFFFFPFNVFCEISKSPCPTSPCPADNQSNQIVSTPELLIPIENLVITQNNPNIGCPPNPTRGFGYSIFFDWTDSISPNGISGYHVFVQRQGSPLPLIDTFVINSEFEFINCNGFVADFNLFDWEWTVQAQDNLGNLSNSSDTGLFQFEQCRLGDGTPCNAPAN